MRRLLSTVVLAVELQVGSCAHEDAGRARHQPGDEATSAPASEGRRVFGVQGIPPGWDKATGGERPKRSPGVGAEGPVLTGTEGDDLIVAEGGTQTVRGLGGGNAMSGGRGRDRIYGGPGDDLINAQDGQKDYIDCGPGRDEVRID